MLLVNPRPVDLFIYSTYIPWIIRGKPPIDIEIVHNRYD
jgi:hypothetical protein